MGRFQLELIYLYGTTENKGKLILRVYKAVMPVIPGHDSRFRQSRDVSRKSSSKKTLTDLTDSGVSVASDSTPVIHPSSQCKDRYVPSSEVLNAESASCAMFCTHSIESNELVAGVYTEVYRFL